MARPFSTKLQIIAKKKGHGGLCSTVYFLSGSIGGKQIRKQGLDLAALMLLKAELESAQQALDLAATQVGHMRYEQTNLTRAQLDEAQTVYRGLPDGVSLSKLLGFWLARMGNGEAVSTLTAFRSWASQLAKDGLARPTVTDNLGRVRRFLGLQAPGRGAADLLVAGDTPKFRYLQDISPKAVKTYLQRDGMAANTLAGDAKILSWWFNWCVSEKLLLENPIPAAVRDELATRAKPTKEPVILTLAQCQRLLDAAVDTYQGRMVPYVILGLWGFLRPDEAKWLPFSQIVTDGGVVRAYLKGDERKYHSRRAVIPANVAPLLLDYIGRARQVQARPNGRKTPTDAVFFSNRVWDQVRERAGLLELNPLTKRGGKQTIKDGSNQTVNDILRHTGMSFLFQQYFNKHAAAGKDENVAIEEATKEATYQAGNSKRIAFTHYLAGVSGKACEEFFVMKPTAL